jgi:hypothetical protein
LYHRLTRRFGAGLESIFMPGGAPQAHEVWFEELKEKVPTKKN